MGANSGSVEDCMGVTVNLWALTPLVPGPNVDAEESTFTFRPQPGCDERIGMLRVQSHFRALGRSYMYQPPCHVQQGRGRPNDWVARPFGG